MDFIVEKPTNVHVEGTLRWALVEAGEGKIVKHGRNKAKLDAFNRLCWVDNDGSTTGPYVTVMSKHLDGWEVVEEKKTLADKRHTEIRGRVAMPHYREEEVKEAIRKFIMLVKHQVGVIDTREGCPTKLHISAIAQDIFGKELI